MYDVVIIGGGPAGYLSAERLGHGGKKVLLIEKSFLGGTCLNVGCIPTKTLLNSAKLYVHALEADRFGIHCERTTYDWQAIQAWKTEVVSKLRAGIAGMMNNYKVTVMEGTGELVSAPKGDAGARVRITLQDGTVQETTGRTVLISTGSVPVLPPIPGVQNNPHILDSTGLLETTKVPTSLTIIGGGVIGVEFASLFAALGSKVTVIEMMDEIVPFMDREQAPILRRAMKGVDFHLGCRVEKIEGSRVWYKNLDGREDQIESELILMAVGRRPQLSGWGAERVCLDIRRQGILVDDRMRTNVPGVWAAGDVTGKSLLAHTAYRMGEVAVSDILTYLDRLEGKNETPRNNRMRYDAIPWAIYGIPEAAGVGITEQEAVERGFSITKASLPMRISGRFSAENSFAAPGACKVIADATTGRILGVHAVGAYASEFIWGAAALIEQELRIKDVQELIFPHPTVSEIIREVVWTM
ncbi:dihydrolipoyl dehydrogenase [Gracilinema caldarium]|uniref:Dihydrolipoyl dehydrogenase n=1 Tax=Gracilinema caldarium (strain ATCC 51460 / DSM 7334 / H1) TaxID=744872 RepID=F8EXU7_GRAC1|nr:dihydrolipoyl dehydrogenase [Gracilinema caldarium]AEJ20111.1 dihydrolipoamide dehydrogenase [Gracilinema caldarium DSM 7334]